MGIASGAGDFGAFHPELVVRLFGYGIGADRLKKARPAGATFELGFHIIQRRAAADAVKNAINLGKVFMAARAFGAAVLGHFIGEV